MQTWKQYYAEHTKGKKFNKGEIQAHMRKLASEYRKMKSGEGLTLKGGEVDSNTEPEAPPAEPKKPPAEPKKAPMPLPAFLNKKKVVEEEVKGKDKEEEDQKTAKMPVVKIPKTRKTRRIDFGKIHWGAFTDDWQKHGGKRKYKTLEEFAKAVLKKPKSFDPLIVKRARFYKNILIKGKGLSML